MNNLTFSEQDVRLVIALAWLYEDTALENSDEELAEKGLSRQRVREIKGEIIALARRIEALVPEEEWANHDR